MEYLPRGDLKNYLQNVLEKERIFTSWVSQFTIWGKQIASGMMHLHYEKILHRDLACRNILLFEQNGTLCVKIGDFGLSRRMEEYVPEKHAFGAYKWMPPEFLDSEIVKFVQGSDVWCFGVVMWEILNWGGEPWPGCPPATAALGVLAGKRLKCPEETPEALRELIESCWAEKPEDRDTFSKLYKRLQIMAKEKF